jgi:AhpD family alkylhydroperoxidase
VRKTFAKRTFTLPLLLISAVTSLLYMPVRWISLVKPATSRALREKVILGMTSVNDCRWCSWLHSGIALKHGVNLDELQALLEFGTFGVLDDREGTAVLFASGSGCRASASSRRARSPAVSIWTTLWKQ